ncbi:hypothetical protein BJ322DRAFT_1216082, partial [Thelephora terrestris]
MTLAGTDMREVEQALRTGAGSPHTKYNEEKVEKLRRLRLLARNCVVKFVPTNVVSSAPSDGGLARGGAAQTCETEVEDLIAGMGGSVSTKASTTDRPPFANEKSLGACISAGRFVCCDSWRSIQRYVGAVWRPPSSTFPSRSTVARKLMSTLSRGTSGPSGHTGSHPPPQLFGGNYAASQPASTHTSPEQSTVNQIRKLTRTVDTILRQQEESSVTKDQFDGLLKALDRLGLGMNDGNVVYKPQLIRNDSLLISLERIKEKLKDASDRLEIMGHTG